MKDNKCQICGLDNRNITGKFGTVKDTDKDRTSIIARTLTNETAARGILSFEDLTKKLEEQVAKEETKKSGILSGLFRSKKDKKKSTSSSVAAAMLLLLYKNLLPLPQVALQVQQVQRTASAVSGPPLDPKDEQIQKHEATIAEQKEVINGHVDTIAKQKEEIAEKDLEVLNRKESIDLYQKTLQKLTAENKKQMEDLINQHSAELRQKDVELDAMVEERTEAKIADMFKPISDSSVFYVKIDEDNAVEKLETIIEKLKDLRSLSVLEERVSKGDENQGKTWFI